MRAGADATRVHGSLLPIPCRLFSRALGASVAVAVARHLHALTCECVRITCFHARWRSLGFDWQEGFPLLFLRLDRWSFCVLGFGLRLLFFIFFFLICPRSPPPQPPPLPPDPLLHPILSLQCQLLQKSIRQRTLTLVFHIVVIFMSQKTACQIFI